MSKRMFAMTSAFSWQASLTCLLLQVSLDFPSFHSTPYDEKNIFLGVSSKRSCKSYIEPFNFSFFNMSGWGIDLVTVTLKGFGNKP